MPGRRRSVRALSAGLLAVGLVVSGATAASLSPYLAWGTVTGSCSGNSYKSTGNLSFDPALHSAQRELGTSVNGYILIGNYNQDGVRTATRYFGCLSGSVKTYYIPVVYNHRAIVRSWYCNGGCSPLPTMYGSWRSGIG